MASRPPPVTLEQLAAAVGALANLAAIERYAKGRPKVEAMPVLRRALRHRLHAVVICAADALAKLGPAAAEAVENLLEAAEVRHGSGDIPQAYAECVRAVTRIAPSDPRLMPLIRRNLHHDNWVPFKASIESLRDVNSAASADLLRRSAEAEQPHLTKVQWRVTRDIVMASERMRQQAGPAGRR